jgi:hypothetical protein
MLSKKNYLICSQGVILVSAKSLKQEETKGGISD